LKREIKVTFVFIILFSLSYFSAIAQNPDKLDYKAKVLEGGKKDGVSYKKLIGNVVFTQEKTIIYCDSATLFDKTNSMEAFGHVRIEDLEDSVTITSERLNYQGNGRMAELRGNVVYKDDSVRLYTDNLDYDMVNKSAVYFGGGKIMDDVNTMTSKKGNYDTEGKMMVFTDSVKLITPDYTLESDDLFYNIITKKARTSSETKITTNNGRILNSRESSEFDTRLGTYAFMVGEIDTEKYLIKGDELFYNNALGSYSAKGHVYLLAKEDDIIITGDAANFWEDQGRAQVYGDPLLKKIMNEDTLYLRADTLISIDDSLEANKRLLAFHNVKIYKADLQGKADSLAYFLSDSSIIFYQDPILWNDGSQITADTIQILVNEGTIDRLNAKVNSFIISEDSTANYNQIKGRMMTAFFAGKSIKNVDVTGNGETIYFIADEESTTEFIGMNKIICTNMKINFAENQVSDIRFYTDPDGKFIPPHELKDDEKKLTGFAWRIEEKPTQQDIMIGPLEAERKRLEDERIYLEELALPLPEQTPKVEDTGATEKAKEEVQNPENQELRQ
jgi:lipopolysaccharide export system protein LptA